MNWLIRFANTKGMNRSITTDSRFADGKEEAPRGELWKILRSRTLLRARGRVLTQCRRSRRVMKPENVTARHSWDQSPSPSRRKVFAFSA